MRSMTKWRVDLSDIICTVHVIFNIFIHKWELFQIYELEIKSE